MNTMTQLSFSEKEYPIELSWVYKNLIGSLISFLLLLILGIIALANFPQYYVLMSLGLLLVSIVLLIALNILIRALTRSNIHYTFDDKGITYRQGIISKQERTIAYNVLQNVYLSQDRNDVLFGLVNLSIENASQGGMMAYTPAQGNTYFSSNGVFIPGLSKKNVQELKVFVLEQMKMKKNSKQPTAGGL